MEAMICITCPIGCHLSIERISDEEIVVTGNKCARGENYAKEEILSPRRVVTSTCRAVEGAAGKSEGLYMPRRVPVRTTKPFPRERIPELLSLLYALEIKLPTRRGDVVVSDALGTGINVNVARTM